MYYVTFTCQDKYGFMERVTISTNYKTRQRNINKAKQYCKLNNAIYVGLISIE